MVVMDNVEQMREVAKRVLGRWLEMAPEMVLLVTGQVAVGHRAEKTLALEPLPTASPDSAGVQLLVDRAQRVKPGFELTADNQGDCQAVVEQLDGLPLAIELAAARMRLFSPKQLRERLGKHLGMLRSRGRERPSRHATLMAAVDWSWQLLSPAEQACLSQCSVFRGGWTLEAAEEVVALPEDSDEWVLDVLEALLDRTMPTWRQHLVHQRYLPHMTVTHAMPAAATGGLGGRFAHQVPDRPDTYVVGDWVGSRGMLADAALASAEIVAEHLLRAAREAA